LVAGDKVTNYFVNNSYPPINNVNRQKFYSFAPFSSIFVLTRPLQRISKTFEIVSKGADLEKTYDSTTSPATARAEASLLALCRASAIVDEVSNCNRQMSWSFGQGHLVIFDFGNAVIAHYI
jgi:hypothetical protein